MTGPNTPPSEQDFARLISRVEELERRLKRGPVSLDDLEDVDAPLPLDQDAILYDATLGRWENTPLPAGGGSSVEPYCTALGEGGLTSTSSPTLSITVDNPTDTDAEAIAHFEGYFLRTAGTDVFGVRGVFTVGTGPGSRSRAFGPVYADHKPNSFGANNDCWLNAHFMWTVPPGGDTVVVTLTFFKVDAGGTTFTIVDSTNLDVLVFLDPTRTSDCNNVESEGG